MNDIKIHIEIWRDLKKNKKKGWYQGFEKEIEAILKLLKKDNQLPGERHYHHMKDEDLSRKIFHANVALPKVNIDKRKGPRLVYTKEDVEIKVLYAGGHKDKRYNNSIKAVPLFKERYSGGEDEFVLFDDDTDFENLDKETTPKEVETEEIKI